MIKRILVALSGTPFTPVATRHALELAARFDAELTGVTILDLARVSYVGPVPVGGSEAAHELIEHRMHLTQEHIDRTVADFREACEKAGRRGVVVRESGNPFEELISLWRYHDLMVVGLRGLFEYGVLHHPVSEIARLLSKGVHPMLAVSDRHRDVKRVVVAYNGSHEAAEAMKQFFQLGLWPDLQVRLVCFERSEDEAKALLHDAEAYCRLHVDSVETAISAAEPREALDDHAREWDADLVVMGCTNRGRLARMVLGDTAVAMLRDSKVPLFLTQ